MRELASHPDVKNIMLVCTAVNDIDLSALESLESINTRLKDAGITFYLSEVKGPVMDKLEGSGFLPHLTGKVFLSQHLGVEELQGKSLPHLKAAAAITAI
jgi:sulfate permease, SulP family